MEMKEEVVCSHRRFRRKEVVKRILSGLIIHGNPVFIEIHYIA